MQDDDRPILDDIMSGNISKYEIIINKYQARIISLCFRSVSYTHLTLPTNREV